MVAIPATGDSLGIAVIVVDVVFLALAAVAIGLRLWSRRITSLALSLNDYLVVMAWVCAFVVYIRHERSDIETADLCGFGGCCHHR